MAVDLTERQLRLLMASDDYAVGAMKAKVDAALQALNSALAAMASCGWNVHDLSLTRGEKSPSVADAVPPLVVGWVSADRYFTPDEPQE